MKRKVVATLTCTIMQKSTGRWVVFEHTPYGDKILWPGSHKTEALAEREIVEASMKLGVKRYQWNVVDSKGNPI